MSCVITDADKLLLQQEAGAAEKETGLRPAQLDIIYRNNWFNLFVPKALGGLEMPLPEALRLEEALAEIDGSLGWTVTLCAGAAWFVGFLDQTLAGDVFSNPKVCLGGSGAATGVAVNAGNGFLVSGRWRFATGAPHLTHFTANCQLADEKGKLFLNEDGSPKIASFIFKKEEVEIIPDWRAMGLIATASHSFHVKDLRVEKTRSFLIDAANTQSPGLVYQYPFLPFAAATLSVNYCGMARHFLRLAAEIFKEKNEVRLQELHQEAVQEMEPLREAFYETVMASWEVVLTGKMLDAVHCEAVNLQSARLADVCIRQVDLLFPHCGMRGADTASEINRVWRDLHTASQHGLLRQLL